MPRSRCRSRGRNWRLRRRRAHSFNGSNKLVPALRDRLNEARCVGIVIERPTDLGHAHIKVPVEIDEDVSAPDLPLDLFPRQNLSGILRQQLQHLQLLWRNLDQYPRATQFAVLQIQLERTETQDTRGGVSGLHGFSIRPTRLQDRQMPSLPNASVVNTGLQRIVQSTLCHK